jgi:hypothetical protein
MSGPGQYIYLLGLLVVPGLLALMLLMQWLEQHFVYRLVADDIARLLRSESPIDDLEARIAVSAQPLFLVDRR